MQHCIIEQSDIDEFDDFIATFPILLSKTAMTAHYSEAVLQSSHARQNWQAPDLVPMPTR